MKITIASGKGGTGKTLLSVNLAYLWQELHPETQTVLVDLDVEEPNDHVFFDGDFTHEENLFRMVPELVRESCTFCGKCKDYCRFNAISVFPNDLLITPELCHSCYACVELCPDNALQMKPFLTGLMRSYKDGKLKLVDGLLNVGESSSIPVLTQVKKSVIDSSNTNDMLIFDAPPGTSCPMIEAVRDTNFVILAAEQTPFGLHDMELAVQTVQMAGIPIGVVANKSNDNMEKLEEVCNRYQIPIIASIPHDIDIARALANGKLVYRDFDSVRNAMKDIEQYILKNIK